MTKNQSPKVLTIDIKKQIKLIKVWERLFLGSFRDAHSLAKSNPYGITTVIALCSGKVSKKNPNINYLQFPIHENRPVPVGQFDLIIDSIAENVRWGTVLLHCVSGTSRAPLTAAAYMHAVGYKNIDSALTELKTLCPKIDPSPVILKSIKELL